MSKIIKRDIALTQLAAISFYDLLKFGGGKSMHRSCLIEDGVTIDCKATIGGINAVWAFNYEEFRGQIVTYIPDGNPGGNSIVSVAGPPITGYKLDFVETSGGATNSLVGGGGTAAKHFSQNVVFTIPKHDQEFINLVTKLSLGKFVILVESKVINEAPTEPANRLFFYGVKNGLTAQTVDGGLGQAKEDLVGYAFAFLGAETEPVSEFLWNQDQTSINTALAILVDRL